MNNGLFAPIQQQMNVPQQYAQGAEFPREGMPSQMPQEGRPSGFPNEGRPAQFPQEGRPAEFPNEGRESISYIGDPLVDKYIHAFIGGVA